MKKRASRPWWPWVVGIATPAILIPMTASMWKHLGEVWAVPTDVGQLKSDVADIKEYTREQRDTQQMIEKAPVGWRWDNRVKDFVPDPTDPRLTNKRGR